MTRYLWGRLQGADRDFYFISHQAVAYEVFVLVQKRNASLSYCRVRWKAMKFLVKC